MPHLTVDSHAALTWPQPAQSAFNDAKAHERLWWLFCRSWGWQNLATSSGFCSPSNWCVEAWHQRPRRRRDSGPASRIPLRKMAKASEKTAAAKVPRGAPASLDCCPSPPNTTQLKRKLYTYIDNCANTTIYTLFRVYRNNYPVSKKTIRSQFACRSILCTQYGYFDYHCLLLFLSFRLCWEVNIEKPKETGVRCCTNFSRARSNVTWNPWNGLSSDVTHLWRLIHHFDMGVFSVDSSRAFSDVGARRMLAPLSGKVTNSYCFRVWEVELQILWNAPKEW